MLTYGTSMSHFLAPIVDNLQAIVEHGGYAILFIVTILEGIPFIGPLIPGHTVVILSGFMIKLGVLNWIVVLVVVISGAVIGEYSRDKANIKAQTRYSTSSVWIPFIFFTFALNTRYLHATIRFSQAMSRRN